ncbi:MAG: ATP-binding cassette domain-containing protein [Pseudomonadota bacterium]
MISINQLHFERGEQTLFRDCTVTLNAGQRIGLVGRNGAGKSTLFDLLLGKLEPSSGELSLPGSWQIQHMAQEVEASDRSAIDFVLDGDQRLRKLETDLAAAEARDDANAIGQLHAELADHDAYTAPARAGTILHGLGFASGSFAAAQRTFSGGWRIRLSLARALMCPASLLLLDEPTNHLDLEATIWLEEHLRRYPGTLIVIAHDREFLDAVTTHTLHVSQQQLTLYTGNYSDFEQQRSEQLTLNAALYEKQQREIAHMENFVRRFRAKASKAKQAQSRVKALERMDRVVLMQTESPYRVGFPNADQFSNPLLKLDDLELAYTEQPVLEHVKASILPGDRIGVLGENGAGKSTLLKALVGDLDARSGEVVRGRHASIGYFAQHQLETLDADDTPLATCKRRLGLSEQAVRNYLGGWGFGKTLCERRILKLSGGEKARLVLALIAHERPGILVLDEPTNHLDLDMRDALALALQDYNGALLLVSHDRTLLQRCVDDYWLVADGRVDCEAHSLDDYTGRVRRERSGRGSERSGRGSERAGSGNNRPGTQNEQTANGHGADRTSPHHEPVLPNGPARESGPASKSGSESGAGAATAAERRRDAAARRRALKPLKDQQRKLEQQVDKLGQELKAVEARLADPEVYNTLPADELDELLARAGKLRKNLDDTEQAWFDLSEELEQRATG